MRSFDFFLVYYNRMEADVSVVVVVVLFCFVSSCNQIKSLLVNAAGSGRVHLFQSMIKMQILFSK